jgi:threonine dehydratase
MGHPEAVTGDLPTFDDVVAAAKRIAPYVRRTPVLRSESLNRLAGCDIRFKCENLQAGGAFKLRGAMNAVWELSGSESRRGVATHSSGNHGAALARAAGSRDIPCYVVIPEGSVPSKVVAVETAGATLRRCAPTMQAREEGLATIVKETGATPVHPFDDARVIAGQGTAALELLTDHPDTDVLMAPVGGGGLLAGTALVARAHAQPVTIVGAEPAQACDTWLSFTRGERVTDYQPNTVADGLRAILGVRNFLLIRRDVDDILLAEEDEILAAMRLIWQYLRVIAEPSSAVPLAALLRHRDRFQGHRVGIVLSGGNVDLDQWLK